MAKYTNDGNETWLTPTNGDDPLWASEAESYQNFIDTTNPARDSIASMLVVDMGELPDDIMEVVTDLADVVWYSHVLQCPHHTRAEKLYAMQEFERLENKHNEL